MRFTSVQLSLGKQLHSAGNIRRWNWLPEQVTLRVGASIGTDPIKFFLGVDSLGEKGHAKAFAQHHDRTDGGSAGRSRSWLWYRPDLFGGLQSEIESGSVIGL